MAKIGNVVDAETANKYASIVPKTRAVIWPKDHLFALSRAQIELKMPQRSLCHLLCLDENITGLFCLPTLTDWSVLCSGISVPLSYSYDFGFMESTTSYRVGLVQSVGDKKKALAEASKFYNEDNLFAIEELPAYYEATLAGRQPDDEHYWRDFYAQMALSLAMLEGFAFSPLTTTKLRPTHKHMGNPRKYPLQFQPIEIINLRLPEKIDHPESTGRSINLRFPVIEHLRRIKDKQTGREKLIKVREHWRGPEDAPIKPHTEKVYKVTR